MDIGEEYVEQFCPVEEPLKSNRFVDESDQTEQARIELQKRELQRKIDKPSILGQIGRALSKIYALKNTKKLTYDDNGNPI